MKTLFVLITLAAFASGCGNESSQTAQSTNASTSSGNPVTAPVDYLGALGKAKQSAEKTVDVTSLNKAIQLFQAEHGRNPTDLNELVKNNYISQIPQAPYGTTLTYDPKVGQVKILKQQ